VAASTFRPTDRTPPNCGRELAALHRRIGYADLRLAALARHLREVGCSAEAFVAQAIREELGGSVFPAPSGPGRGGHAAGYQRAA
jgi:hypothetical protein